MKSVLFFMGALLCGAIIWQMSPYISWDGSAAPFIQTEPEFHGSVWQKLMVFLFSPVVVIVLSLALSVFFILGCFLLHRQFTRPSIKA